jgi:hypothetical protein
MSEFEEGLRTEGWGQIRVQRELVLTLSPQPSALSPQPILTPAAYSTPRALPENGR